jgi:hypothetical protein
MNPCAVDTSAASSEHRLSVAGVPIGGGTASNAGGNDHAAGCDLGAVTARGWRPLTVRNDHASRLMRDGAVNNVSAGAPGRYPGPQFQINAELVSTSEAPMTLVELFTTAIITLSPNLPGETATRYATDIEAAVDADLELGMALIVTMGTEVRERHEEVERCICRPWECDRGTDGKPRALGIYQLHFYWWDGHSREEICASHPLQARLVAKEMRSHIGVTRGNWARALRRHVGYNVDPKDPRVVDRPKNFYRVLANARRSLAIN